MCIHNTDLIRFRRSLLLLITLAVVSACIPPIMAGNLDAGEGDDAGPGDDAGQGSVGQTEGHCTLTLTNNTGFPLDSVDLFPADFIAVYTSLTEVPLADDDAVTIELPVGEYELRANNGEFVYFFKSVGHLCVEFEALEITANFSDLQVGKITVYNAIDRPVVALILASTDDLIFGDNQLSEPILASTQVDLSPGDGRYYYLAEDDAGGRYFGSTRIVGSSNGVANINAASEADPNLCTVTLSNNTGFSINALIVHDGTPFSNNNEVLDSRGVLPNSETLEVLTPLGTWTIVGLSDESNIQFAVDGVLCVNGETVSANLQMGNMGPSED